MGSALVWAVPYNVFHKLHMLRCNVVELGGAASLPNYTGALCGIINYLLINPPNNYSHLLTPLNVLVHSIYTYMYTP